MWFVSTRRVQREEAAPADALNTHFTRGLVRAAEGELSQRLDPAQLPPAMRGVIDESNITNY